MHPFLRIDAFGILCFAAGCAVLGLSLLLVSRSLKWHRGLIALCLALIGLGLGASLAWSQWQDGQIEVYDANSRLLAQLGGARNSRASLVALTDRGRVIPL